jgi:hypothetical protein
MRSIVEIDEQFRRVIQKRADVKRSIDRKLEEIAALRQGYAAQGQLLDRLMDERLLVQHGNAIAETIVKLGGDPDMDLPPRTPAPAPQQDS